MRKAQGHLVAHDGPGKVDGPEDEPCGEANEQSGARLHQHDEHKPDVVGDILRQGAIGKSRQAVGQYCSHEHPHPSGDAVLSKKGRRYEQPAQPHEDEQYADDIAGVEQGHEDLVWRETPASERGNVGALSLRRWE